ncbi:hypothetical protein B0J12DRAFT_786762 [Macrophomina phaseolina]|uniref:Uncharacterized protein n=1 Tax=Macrophomina phaseolina TaxID=35725 RepID=A0ABQ8G7V9_9PEZI|nr:hypothetical protein B0J12DRAFT_786762 [Macrophomina phaseolina]
MKFFDFAITAVVLGLTISSAGAAPAGDASANAISGKRVDCAAIAAIIRKWTEDALQRFRVAFSVTRPDFSNGRLEESCSLWTHDTITTKPSGKCSGISNNVACYHSAADQSWVVDNNQLIGSGDPIEDCIVTVFRDVLASKWGCHV